MAILPRMALPSIRPLLLVQVLVFAAPALLAAQEPPAAPPSSADTAPAEPAPTAASAPEPMPAEQAPPTAPPEDLPPPPPPPPPPEEPVPAGRYDGQVDRGGYAQETYPEDGDPEPSGAGGKFEMPGISIRLDPFNWLLDGRLGVELEVAPLKWLSVELVPVFVANSEPPTIDFSSLDEDISQHSNGLGALAGTSLGVGFWLDGEAFRGYVLRAIFTNYGYTFKATDGSGTFDRVDRTERRLMGFFGSYMRWAFFTIGGGLGLGYELNQQERCRLRSVPTTNGTRIAADPAADCDGELQLAADRGASRVFDVNGFLHPVYLEGRLSLGFIID
jgi:hypothetical protein